MVVAVPTLSLGSVRHCLGVTLYPKPGLSAVYVVRTTSAKFGLQASSVKFEIRYTESRMNTYTYNYMCNVTCLFVCTSRAMECNGGNRKGKGKAIPLQAWTGR